MSLAISGKKVILVEFDLNNPTLAFKLGIDGDKGIADYLAGDVEADEVIPKHGSWLNMAEIELHLLNGQCLNRNISTMKKISEEVDAGKPTEIIKIEK